MAYTAFDNPTEFFNASPTTAGYSVAVGSITMGTVSHATEANRFLVDLTDVQAELATGSTAQVLYALFNAICERFEDIPTADRPTKFAISKSGFIDSATGEHVITFNATIRATAAPGSLTAVNS